MLPALVLVGARGFEPPKELFELYWQADWLGCRARAAQFLSIFVQCGNGGRVVLLSFYDGFLVEEGPYCD